MSVPLQYRRVLAVVTVGLFFTAADDYFFTSGVISIPPLYWMAALGLLVLPLLGTGDTFTRVMRSPLTWWSGYYLALTILAFMWSSQTPTAWGEVRLRLLAVLFLFVLMVLFADPRIHRITRIAILCGVIFAVLLNTIDLIRPRTFTSIVGRSAGFYTNPNISAIALILGMTMTIQLVSRWLRPWYVCFVGAGVLLTFSRGGAVTWVAVTMLFVALGSVRLAPLLRVVVGGTAVVIGALVLLGLWDTALQAASFVGGDTWEKLRLGTGMRDASAGARLEDAVRAWEMFAEYPVFGAGVGATTEWDWVESTHNMYLRHVAEYGIIGITIIPLLVLAVRRATAGWSNRTALWLSAIVITWSVFSHNLLDERHFLICLALAVMMRADSVNEGA